MYMSTRMMCYVCGMWTDGFFLLVQFFPQRRVFYALARFFPLRVPLAPSKSCMYV